MTMVKAAEKWWCAVCGVWRKPMLGSQIGAMCPTCRSGRIRPPLRGEKAPD